MFTNLGYRPTQLTASIFYTTLSKGEKTLCVILRLLFCSSRHLKLKFSFSKIAQGFSIGAVGSLLHKYNLQIHQLSNYSLKSGLGSLNVFCLKNLSKKIPEALSEISQLSLDGSNDQQSQQNKTFMSKIIL